ncbi:MAG TPA: universal stress protein [Dehalococcoidia bacterium]|nr:universal stress protein [Dehalococcoidia bacterium]
MYERILVPLDGSVLSEAALSHAEAIGKQFESTLILLQVVAPPPQAGTDIPVGTFSVTSDQDRAEAERYLGTITERLTSRQLKTETRIVIGHAADEILSSAAGAQASLVVMATQGRGGLGRAIFGSVANEVLQRCHLPLLLIHPE